MFGSDIAEPGFLLTKYNKSAAAITIEYNVARVDLTGSGVDESTLMVEPRHAGFGMIGLDAAIGDTGTLAFDDFEIWEPNSPRGHIFFAFRDPGLGGT